MATTGAELSKIFDQKIGQAFTGFLDATKKNRVFKEATIKAIENKYKTLIEQKQNDEIASVIVTEQVFTPANNKIFISAIGTPNIPNYMHFLSMRVRFNQIQINTSITGATYSTPIVITMGARGNFRTEEPIKISGVTGNTAANGLFYIKSLNKTSFALYTDFNLTVPVAGSGVYASGGTIYRTSYEYVKPYYSDRKINSFGGPAVDTPKYEISSGQIKIYPTTEVAEEITIDYISTAAVFIDVSNNTIDLELTYPLKFLYYIIDIAKGMFAEQVRDDSLIQLSNMDTTKNI